MYCIILENRGTKTILNRKYFITKSGGALKVLFHISVLCLNHNMFSLNEKRKKSNMKIFNMEKDCGNNGIYTTWEENEVAAFTGRHCSVFYTQGSYRRHLNLRAYSQDRARERGGNM